jgi:hypothetical protein
MGRILAIKSNEWRWLAGWAVIIVLLTNLPFILGALASTPANQYGGFVYGLEDGNSYLAKMQEGAAGSWLFYLAYTPEPHSGGPFFIMYLLLGKVARLLNLSLIVVLHVSRVLASIFTLGTFYAVSAFFVRSVAIRRAAFILFGLGGGLGWLWTLLALPFGPGVMPVDLWVPEATFFLSTLTFPHLTLSLAFQLWCVTGLLWFLDIGRWPAWLLAAGSGLLMTLIHPYKFVIVLPVVGLYILWQVYRQNYKFRPSIRRLLWVVLPTIPYFTYAVIVFSRNEVFIGWRVQNLTWSPSLLLYLLGFGLLLPLALVGCWRLYNDNDSTQLCHQNYLLLWFGVTPLLVYLPLAIQRRFLDGYQVVVALLAGIGVVWLLERFPSGWRLPVATAGVLFVSLTNLMLLAGSISIVSARQQPHFHPEYEVAAYDWLAENASSRQVVLSAYATGNVLPAYAPLNVFVGHGSETVNFTEKMTLVERFFAINTPNDWRRSLLEQYGVDYLYYGPNEQAVGEFQPANATYMKPVYANGTVTIFRVQP